jgi:hypothetical protein
VADVEVAGGGLSFAAEGVLVAAGALSFAGLFPFTTSVADVVDVLVLASA